MKFETKCKKLGITEEVKSIMDNCELYEGKGARIIELHKLRKWEIKEEIANYLQNWDYDKESMSKFCKKMNIKENEIAQYYAYGICEGAEEIAYAINDDVVLVLV